MLAASLITAFAIGFGEGIRPEPPVSLVEWADEKRVLSSKASSEPGKWRTSRVPFMAEIMECLSVTSDVQRIALMKGAQIAGTEIGNNWVAYTIDHVPGPMMAVQPTIDMGKRWSRQRFQPMIEEMPCLTDKIADARSRDSGNTLLSKEFDGGILVVSGANSASSLRSMPVRYLFLDEIDAYPGDVDGEGDPVDLAINRTKTYGRKKIFMPSTPTTAEVSRIEREFDAGDQCYYHVPCPHCGEKQKLEWKNMRWQKTPVHRPETAVYMCAHCAAEIEEYHKETMLAQGEWIPENPDAPKNRRSFHLSSLYSPLGWESWEEIVRNFLEAKGNLEKLKTWTNTTLAETWKEQVNEIKPAMLQARAEPYEIGIIPEGALVLTAAVDCQDNRLEGAIYGFGRGEETWTIATHVVYGDPGDKKTRTEMENWLWGDGFATEHGIRVDVSCVAVDTGGHYTHEMYNWVRENQHRGMIAIKGSSKKGSAVIGRPSYVDVNQRGKVIKRGVKLWRIGTDTAKITIYNRYMKEEHGPGYIHFPEGLPLDHYEQLTAEKLIKRYRKGFEVYEWVKDPAQRNEQTDLIVYAYAAALSPDVAIHRNRESDWARLEEQINPANLDLFAGTAHQAGAVPVPPPAQPKNQGFGSEEWNL